MATKYLDAKRAHALTRCTLCKRPLPGRIPRQYAASRCSSCQMTQHELLTMTGQRVDHPPENVEIIENRIALYSLRASACLPLFGGSNEA